MYDKNKIREACKWAIYNIQKESITDVDLFNRPFEIDLLNNQEVTKVVKDFVEEAIFSGKLDTLKIHKIGHVLMPKKSLCDFRKCALIDVIDEIIYLTIVLLMAKSIEERRINKSLNKVFSYRFIPNKECLFDNKYHFTSFRSTVYQKTYSRNNNIVVECDISNYYDRLNLHRLESVLFSIEKIDQDTVKLLNEVLLYWANRDSYGLPVGSNASRILAEAALIDVDNYLVSQKINFCRFVDDYRIFTKDASTAHSHLAILAECLNREGLFVNTSKTRIKDISKLVNNKPSKEESTREETIDEDLEPEQIEDSKKAAKNEESPKIIRGYSGLIPTKFRELTISEKNTLLKEDVDNKLNVLKESVLVEPIEMTQVMKIIVAKERYDLLIEIPDVLRKFPQFIPYCVDVLIKKESLISDNVIEKIKIGFALWFTEPNTPEYILVYLVKVFSIGKFTDKEVLLSAFRNSKRVSGNYIGRALLESFNAKLTRGELLEIREYYLRADQWEKRQILKLVQAGLSEGEKRAFFKDVRIHNQDLFSNFIMSNNQEILKNIGLAEKKVKN